MRLNLCENRPPVEEGRRPDLRSLSGAGPHPPRGLLSDGRNAGNLRDPGERGPGLSLGLPVPEPGDAGPGPSHRGPAVPVRPGAARPARGRVFLTLVGFSPHRSAGSGSAHFPLATTQHACKLRFAQSTGSTLLQCVPPFQPPSRAAPDGVGIHLGGGSAPSPPNTLLDFRRRLNGQVGKPVVGQALEIGPDQGFLGGRDVAALTAIDLLCQHDDEFAVGPAVPQTVR